MPLLIDWADYSEEKPTTPKQRRACRRLGAASDWKIAQMTRTEAAKAIAEGIVEMSRIKARQATVAADSGNVRAESSHAS